MPVILAFKRLRQEDHDSRPAKTTNQDPVKTKQNKTKTEWRFWGSEGEEMRSSQHTRHKTQYFGVGQWACPTEWVVMLAGPQCKRSLCHWTVHLSTVKMVKFDVMHISPQKQQSNPFKTKPQRPPSKSGGAYDQGREWEYYLSPIVLNHSKQNKPLH